MGRRYEITDFFHFVAIHQKDRKDKQSFGLTNNLSIHCFLH